MEKRELLRQMDVARNYFGMVRGTYEVTIQKRNQLEQLYRVPKKSLKKGSIAALIICTVFAWFLSVYFFSSFVVSLGKKNYPNWTEDFGATLEVIGFFALTALAIFFIIFMIIFWHIEYKKAIVAHQKKIEQVNNEIGYNTQILLNHYAAFEQKNGFICPVSIKYSYPDTISLFMGYIDEGRADNVKEAINLSISEMRYEQEVMQRNRMYSAVQNVNANARRAAVFSGIAAAASIFGALSSSD